MDSNYMRSLPESTMIGKKAGLSERDKLTKPSNDEGVGKNRAARRKQAALARKIVTHDDGDRICCIGNDR